MTVRLHALVLISPLYGHIFFVTKESPNSRKLNPAPPRMPNRTDAFRHGNRASCTCESSCLNTYRLSASGTNDRTICFLLPLLITRLSAYIPAHVNSYMSPLLRTSLPVRIVVWTYIHRNKYNAATAES